MNLFIKKVKNYFIKNPPCLSSIKEIDTWCQEMNLTNYTINPDLTVDVNGDVFLQNKNLKSFPVQFNIVKGFFDCSHNYLTSLKGLPQKIEGSVNCSHNYLTSLQYLPSLIEGDLDCSFNKILSLDYVPDEIYGSFIMSYNNVRLVKIKALPKIKSCYDFRQNKNISFDLSSTTKIEKLFLADISILKNLSQINQFDSLSLSSYKKTILNDIQIDSSHLAFQGPIQLGKNVDIMANEIRHEVNEIKHFLKKFKNNYQYMFNKYENYNLILNLEGSLFRSILNNEGNLIKPTKVNEIKIKTPLKKLLSQKDIKSWLDKMNIKNYIIHENLVVDVKEDVFLQSKGLQCFPFKFGKVEGNFNCSDNFLKSLKGSPDVVKGSFNCSHNLLKTLKYAPNSVKDSFICNFNQLKTLKFVSQNPLSLDCSSNKLKNLKYCPNSIINKFDCSYNNLKSLKNGPQKAKKYLCEQNNLKTLQYGPIEVEEFFCRSNKLDSLKYCPKKVSDFLCSNNHLKSLVGSPIKVRNFSCSNNKLTSLEGAPNEIELQFDCSQNQLKDLNMGPQVVSNYVCSDNQLTSLKGVPNELLSLICANNQLTHLKDLDKVKIHNHIDCSDNYLTNLESIPMMATHYNCSKNPLLSFKGLPFNMQILSVSLDDLVDMSYMPQPSNSLSIYCEKFKIIKNISFCSNYINLGKSKIQFGENVYMNCIQLSHIKNQSNYFLKGLHNLYSGAKGFDYSLTIHSDIFNSLYNSTFEKELFEEIVIKEKEVTPKKKIKI